MHPKIKELCYVLEQHAALLDCSGMAYIAADIRHSISAHQAVLDPENQPSQYGTTLLPK